MENFDSTGMQDITTYAPMRVALVGFGRILFGLLLGLPAVALIWMAIAGEAKPTHPGDMPGWWAYVLGAAFAFGALAQLFSGIGRLVAAFSSECFFRAGPGGIAIRLPKIRWFGHFRIVEYRFAWPEISRLVHFTRKVNGIPMSRELRFELVNGKRLSIERYMFSASIKTIQKELLSIQTFVAR